MTRRRRRHGHKEEMTVMGIVFLEDLLQQIVNPFAVLRGAHIGDVLLVCSGHLHIVVSKTVYTIEPATIQGQLLQRLVAMAEEHTRYDPINACDVLTGLIVLSTDPELDSMLDGFSERFQERLDSLTVDYTPEDPPEGYFDSVEEELAKLIKEYSIPIDQKKTEFFAAKM